jgi:excisionase family DNA binding protein
MKEAVKGINIDLSKRSYLTPAEVAIFLNASKVAVYEAIKADELLAHKFPCIGLRVHVNDLKEYIERSAMRVDG